MHSYFDTCIYNTSGLTRHLSAVRYIAPEIIAISDIIVILKTIMPLNI